MASKLKAVKPTAAQPSKPKILVFGNPGVGKTWTALDFPNCFYIDTEGGANLPQYIQKLEKSNGVYMGPEQGSLSFNEILGQIKALATEDHPYKTLVIDSISKIFNMEVAAEAERLGDRNAFGADKRPAISMMRRLASWLVRLDMNVILVAHQKPLWGMNSKKERVEIGVTFDAWDKLEYELHLCLNVIKEDGKRFCKVTKSRFMQFPDSSTFPWNFDEFANRYGRDVIMQTSKKIELATEEQVKELKELLEVIVVSEETQEKWFKAANASSFEEMEASQVQKIIAWVRQKGNPKILSIPFDFDHYRKALLSAKTEAELNDVYKTLVQNRVPPLEEKEIAQCQALLAEATDRFYAGV